MKNLIEIIILIVAVVAVNFIDGQKGVEIFFGLVFLAFIHRFINSLTDDHDRSGKDIVKMPQQKEKKKSILEKILEENKDFDNVHFLNFAKNTFLKHYMSDEKNRVEMIENRKRIQINDVRISHYDKVEEKEIIRVLLDYTEIVTEYNEKTGELMKGLKRTYEKTSVLSFEKMNVVKGDEKIKAVKCENCGAPLENSTIGNCIYCGCKMQLREIEWKMIDIK